MGDIKENDGGKAESERIVLRIGEFRKGVEFGSASDLFFRSHQNHEYWGSLCYKALRGLGGYFKLFILLEMCFKALTNVLIAGPPMGYLSTDLTDWDKKYSKEKSYAVVDMHYEIMSRMVADLFSFHYSLTMKYMYVTYIILGESRDESKYMGGKDVWRSYAKIMPS